MAVPPPAFARPIVIAPLSLRSFTRSSCALNPPNSNMPEEPLARWCGSRVSSCVSKTPTV